MKSYNKKVAKHAAAAVKQIEEARKRLENSTFWGKVPQLPVPCCTTADAITSHMGAVVAARLHKQLAEMEDLNSGKWA